jgi:hypothetical protein
MPHEILSDADSSNRWGSGRGIPLPDSANSKAKKQMKSTQANFKVYRTDVFNKHGKLICSVWPDRSVSQERQDGESWLEMRNRTDPERLAIERETEKRAAAICDLLNDKA